MKNRYKGTCVVCGGYVAAFDGNLGKRNGKYVIYCDDCYSPAGDKNDNSSYEDRECGDMAYEDRCAAQCGC